MMLADGAELVDAREKASADLGKLLPDGPTTSGHSLRSLQSDAGESVGMIWYGPDTSPEGRPVVFVYDLFISPEHRRNGYGKAALDRLFSIEADTAATAVMLHVFAHNTEAIALYQQYGFALEDSRPGHVLMGKSL